MAKVSILLLSSKKYFKVLNYTAYRLSKYNLEFDHFLFSCPGLHEQTLNIPSIFSGIHVDIPSSWSSDLKTILQNINTGYVFIWIEDLYPYKIDLDLFQCY